MAAPGKYRLVWAKPVVKEEFYALDSSIRRRVETQLRKLQVKPKLGQPCGHKMGYDLTGYRSLHFYENKYRIVYEIVEAEKKVRIWGIGKRERGKIYRMVDERVGGGKE